MQDHQQFLALLAQRIAETALILDQPSIQMRRCGIAIGIVGGQQAAQRALELDVAAGGRERCRAEIRLRLRQTRSVAKPQARMAGRDLQVDRRCRAGGEQRKECRQTQAGHGRDAEVKHAGKCNAM